MATKKFDAGQAVETLRYDFAPYVTDAMGAVPEPSTDQLTTFRQAIGGIIRDTMGEVDLDADTDEAKENARAKVRDQIEEISKFLLRDDSEVAEKITQAVAEVCGEHPSYEQIKALPGRVKQAFVGFITGAFLSPEGLLPALNRSQAGTDDEPKSISPLGISA